MLSKKAFLGAVNNKCPKNFWLHTNLINNIVSYEIQTTREGEGKALGQVDAKSFSKSSDVCEACRVKNKIISIFIQQSKCLVQMQLILTNKSIQFISFVAVVTSCVSVSSLAV